MGQRQRAEIASREIEKQRSREERRREKGPGMRTCAPCAEYLDYHIFVYIYNDVPCTNTW